MTEEYQAEKHVEAILEQTAAEELAAKSAEEAAKAGQEAAKSEQDATKAGQEAAKAGQEAAKAHGVKDEQIRLRLDEIYSAIKTVEDRVWIGPIDSSSVIGLVASALAQGLERLAHVASEDAVRPSREAAERIEHFVLDNESAATNEEIAAAIEAISPEGIVDPPTYAQAVYPAVAGAVLDPGRNLPHKMRALEEACEILAAATMKTPQHTGPSAPRDVAPPPPSTASSEILRDVSHLTTLILGSSPAFADAMRMQSDALAYSLAAFNKVGDMQRQDALGLAITARAAATEFDRS